MIIKHYKKNFQLHIFGPKFLSWLFIENFIITIMLIILFKKIV